MLSAPAAATRHWKHTLVYIGLVAIAAGAGILFAFSLHKPAPSKASQALQAAMKSEWEPTASSEAARLRQIAAYVGGRYQFANGKQFAELTVETPKVDGQPATSVAVEHIAAGSEDKSAISDAAIYNLCGSNADCTVPGSQNATARAQLMQREALELALRTFRAQTNIHIVVVEMPVIEDQVGRLDVYFVRDDLSRANSEPISATLPLRKPPLVGKADPVEAKTISSLVVNAAFTTSDAATRKAHEFVLVPLAEAMQVAQAGNAAGATSATP